MNSNIIKLAKHICSFNEDIDAEEYAKQLNMLYGAICEIGAFEPVMFDEAVEIERSRIKKYGANITKLIDNVETLIFEYSKIAFDLAADSLYNARAFHIAVPLTSVFSELAASNLIDHDERSKLRVTISESKLDFKYAAGDHNISSLRMAQLIKKHNIQNGGK